MHPDLYKAVTEGNSASLLQLLEAEDRDLHPQQRDQNKNTLLHIAAGFNNVAVVKIIYEKLPRFILRSKNYRGDTALHIAARHNNVDVVLYLSFWAKEIDEAEKRSKRYLMAKIKNRDGNTALHEAVLRGHRQAIDALMKLNEELIFIKNNRNESPFYLAADRGLYVVLCYMLDIALVDQNYTRKDQSGPHGRTPLHAAIAKKRTLCVNILLDGMKELISKADADGRNPLHYTALFGHSEEASCLLQIDSSIALREDNEGLYPIHLAANKGSVQIIQDMIKYFPEAIETLNRDHQNVVHLAAKNGRLNLVRYMLEQKPKFDKLINAKDIHGNTPLHLATMNSHAKVVYILIGDRYVDMTIMNDESLTALDIAEKQMDDTTSLPEFLTLMALRINNAPSSGPSIVEEDTSKANRKKEEYKEKFKKRFDTLVVVATLISTVTFAAGFTVPGGFNGDGPDKGIATLLRKPAFIVFLICNTLALYLSMVVVGNIIWAQLDDSLSLILAVYLSKLLLGAALHLMAVAFAAGLYSVINKLQWLTVVGLFIGATFIYYIIIFAVLFSSLYDKSKSKYLVPRKILKWYFDLLMTWTVTSNGVKD